MQRRASELRQVWKEAAVTRILVCRRVPGHFFIFRKRIFMNSQTYQVIARRWRPKQFSELVGQDHIVRTLTNAIELNRIAHAYLFVGPRGTGKTSTARLFAKSLNCTGGPSITPPEDCPICKAIMDGSCMDVIEIDGASNNSVDQIRDLREDCQYAPTQSRFKIYIIDEVHMLTTAAFNALLKTLEEPPAHVKFIFATTEAHKVLPTIVSRCQRFEFRPISNEVIAEKLKIIAKAEGLNIEDTVFHPIARLAMGGMRDAQSILDQLISFCGKTITEEDVMNVYGLASSLEMRNLIKAMAKADYAKIIEISEKFDGQGRDLYRILQDLQHLLHEVLLDAIKNSGVSLKLEVAKTTESLMRMLDVVQQGEECLRMGLSQRVNFEITLLKAVEQSQTRAIDSLIREITVLKNQYPEKSEQKKNIDIELSLEHKLEKEEKNKFKEEAVIQEVLEEQYKYNSGTFDEEILLEELLEDSLQNQKDEKSEAVAAIEEAKKQLPQSTLDILENRFRAEFKAVRPLKLEEWLYS